MQIGRKTPESAHVFCEIKCNLYGQREKSIVSYMGKSKNLKDVL